MSALFFCSDFRYPLDMTEVLDIKQVRSDFPLLGTSMRGHDLIYFDNGATSLKPASVIEAITGYYEGYSANIHRGVYEMSGRATTAYDEARAALKAFIHAEEGEVIFTRGTTESINMVATGWGGRHVGQGDVIVLSPMEHHSNIVPWQQLASRTGATLSFIPLTADGAITIEAIEESITEKTRIVAVSAMSNVTGYTPPIDTIIDRAHAVGARVLLDGAQYVSHHETDVQRLGCDFLVFSGHKMCGPTGIGALYGRHDALEEMDPFLFGGDMISRVYLNSATWAHIPERFEGGTPNIAGAIGVGAAARYLSQVGMSAVSAHEAMLTSRLREILSEREVITLYGPSESDEAGGIVSFNVDGIHPNDIGALLDQQGIAVRTGFHCAQPLMDHFGVTGTVRASFYLYNTEEEVDRFAVALDRALSILR